MPLFEARFAQEYKGIFDTKMERYWLKQLWQSVQDKEDTCTGE